MILKRQTTTGFTLIEVSLFVAISGFIIAGIIAGTGASIARQRYNDSVNSFTEFLRGVYSEVINVENTRLSGSSENRTCTVSSATPLEGAKPGRSECVLYGKLITFGESDNSSLVHVYDIVGGSTIRIDVNTYRDTAAFSNVNSIISALQAVGADVIAPKDVDGLANYAGGHYTYTPEWGASLQKTNEETPYTGTLAIFRSPLSGTVHTFVLPNTTISASELINQAAPSIASAASNSNLLSAYLNSAEFTNTSDVDFCIGSDDVFVINGRRRNVRIRADGNTANAVELIPMDSEDNRCQ